jgi:hypothetical protein
MLPTSIRRDTARDSLRPARGRRATAAASVVLAVIAVVGCDQASSSNPSPAQPSAAGSPPGSLLVSPSIGPSGSPTAAGTWVSPPANATVTTYTIDLSAKPAGSAVSKVRFIVGWRGTSKDACIATKAGSSGAWSCTADLAKLGVAAGSLNFSFKATPADGSAAIAGPKRTITWSVKPATPTGTYKETPIAGAADGADNATVKVTWKERLTGGVTMKVYAVLNCLAPAESTGKDCVTNSSVIPSSALKLLRSVPVSDGSVSWTYLHEDIGGAVGMYSGSTYEGIILIAENSVGRSHFTVLVSSTSCFGCTY